MKNIKTATSYTLRLRKPTLYTVAKPVAIVPRPKVIVLRKVVSISLQAAA